MLRTHCEDDLLGRTMRERDSGEPGLEPGLADLMRVRAIAAGGAANPERRAAESDGECGDRASSLAALTHWRPFGGPIHARPPTSCFEVGLHPRCGFTSQDVFRQMSEPT